MEHLRCVVERITYQNAENDYSVLKVAVKKEQDLVTVVGTMPETHVGSVLSLEGYWKVDAKYGRQFCAEKFEETLPAEAVKAKDLPVALHVSTKKQPVLTAQTTAYLRVVNGEAAGMGIREDGRITGNRARFIPHVIEG